MLATAAVADAIASTLENPRRLEMIYDTVRLVRVYLEALPETCEGVELEALEERIHADLPGSHGRLNVEALLHQAGWYKHHHRLDDGSLRLQVRRCYCGRDRARDSDARAVCEARKSVPASSPLPKVTTDYETNLEGAFWNWVCNLDAEDDPRGDFIRDTRDSLALGNNPESDMFGACDEARREYVKLRTQWAAAMGVHPEDASPLNGRAAVWGTEWYYGHSEDCDWAEDCGDGGDY